MQNNNTLTEAEAIKKTETHIDDHDSGDTDNSSAFTNEENADTQNVSQPEHADTFLQQSEHILKDMATSIGNAISNGTSKV